MRAGLLACCALVMLALPVRAQQYDQAAISDILDRQGSGPLPEQPLAYVTYRFDHPSGNSIRARQALYDTLGRGNVEVGREWLPLVLFLNGLSPSELVLGDTLVLLAQPENWDVDPLAFSPFPAVWPGATAFDRAVVVDKAVQGWGAYERGRLVRWGPASTGATSTPTPSGRFTMNWRQLERVSSESPPGEEWRMRYVMNIHATRGIHLHQYDEVPTGRPEGHGCVRLVMADARWLWGWSVPWTTTTGAGALSGRVLDEGTLVIVQGEEPVGRPQRFVLNGARAYPVRVPLPADPMAVPRGDR